MESSNFYTAKTDLKYIYNPYKAFVTFEDSLQQIIIIFNDPKKRSLHFDTEMLKIRIFLALFFLGTLTFTASASKMEINISFVIYASIVALGISLFTTLTTKTQILIDFDKKLVKFNNRKVNFSDCKNVIIENTSLNLIPVSFNVIIETSMGKVNMPLMQFPYTLEGESNAQDLADWATKHIVNSVIK